MNCKLTTILAITGPGDFLYNKPQTIQHILPSLKLKCAAFVLKCTKTNLTGTFIQHGHISLNILQVKTRCTLETFVDTNFDVKTNFEA